MKTILVVDDEFDLLQAITAILEIEGYKVVSAGNGKAALEILQESAPDLVITDFMMPYITGDELVKRMQQIPACRSVPALMMSGANPPRVTGAKAILRKPFTSDKLVDAVKRTIGKAAA